MTQFVIRASRIEQFIQEKEQNKANRINRDPYLVFIINNDMSMEITDLLKEYLFEVMATKIIKGRLYSCPTLKWLKGKEVVRLENKEEFSFNISKAD